MRIELLFLTEHSYTDLRHCTDGPRVNQELQEEVYSNVFLKVPAQKSMNKEEKMFHVALLEKLLDKQKVLYTRLSLSDDPEAKMMKQRIVESATMMGLPQDVDISVIFSNMGKMLDAMKKQIDIQGSDL